MTEASTRTLQVCVLGGGSWGTALAAVLARKGHSVKIWAREPEVAEAIRGGENSIFLPGIALPKGLNATDDLSEAVRDATVLVSAVPAQFSGSVLERVAPLLSGSALVVSASKGIETELLRTMDQLFLDSLGPSIADRFAVLSGPSFAAEVGARQPTAVVVASRSSDTRSRVQQLFQTDDFRVYTSSDVLGVELGGALKNVIALAAGVVAGLGFGHNTLAALITRGLVEMTRLGVAMGASAETFAGLAGMGDLVLTCTGGLSRNRTVGFRLGKGESLDEILASVNSVAEGVRTAEAVKTLADRRGVEMPICEEVYAILFANRDPAEALRRLMIRDPKPE